jgi:hypothetical protein
LRHGFKAEAMGWRSVLSGKLYVDQIIDILFDLLRGFFYIRIKHETIKFSDLIYFLPGSRVSPQFFCRYAIALVRKVIAYGTLRCLNLFKIK